MTIQMKAIVLHESVLIFCLCARQGQAYINEFNLGRYWPVVGPQMALYVPASTLLPGQQPTKLVLFELDSSPCENPDSCYVVFLDKPKLDGPVHPMN